MLHADKEALQTDLKVSLLSIRDKELSYYTRNCQAIGTQASLLAGFAYGGISVDLSKTNHEAFKAIFLITTTASMCFCIMCILGSTWCTLAGPGLALRGPEGSMDRAVQGLATEYRIVFVLFVLGLICLFTSVAMFIWLEFEIHLSAVIFALYVVVMRWTSRTFVRLYKKFRLPPHMAVSGEFSADGRANPTSPNQGLSAESMELIEIRQQKQQNPHRHGIRKKLRLWYLSYKVSWDEFLGVAGSQSQKSRYCRVNSAGEVVYEDKASVNSIIRHLEHNGKHSGKHVRQSTKFHQFRDSDDGGPSIPPSAQQSPYAPDEPYTHPPPR